MALPKFKHPTAREQADSIRGYAHELLAIADVLDPPKRPKAQVRKKARQRRRLEVVKEEPAASSNGVKLALGTSTQPSPEEQREREESLVHTTEQGNQSGETVPPDDDHQASRMGWRTPSVG